MRPNNPSPTSTPEELGRRAIIQRNDLILHEAVIKNDVDTVRKILREPVDINCRNNEAQTALHVACEKGHVEVVEYLLAHDSDMEARDNGGNTPLHLASQNQQTHVVELLLNSGADPDSENSKGSTALHTASSLGSKGILDLLLQHGALLNMQNKNGNTPLHMACQANESQTVEMLINRGADLNSLNQRLQSPIHIAAEMGYTDICKLLLVAGANIEQREQGGRTPLYIAARGSFTAIVDMIIKTARLDYPAHEDEQNKVQRKDSLLKQSVNSTRRKFRSGKEELKGKDSERFKEVLYKLANKQLGPGEWKKLAQHWAFTEEQIRAVEHQYTGPSSYKEHGFRVMLIWVHGLPPEANPMRELYEGLTAIGKRSVADALRRKVDLENEERRKGSQRSCGRCNLT